MEEKGNNIYSIELASYVRPTIVEDDEDKKWVDYVYSRDLQGGYESQSYFDYVLDRYYGSPTNNSSINGIAGLIYGQGYEATNASENAEQWALFHSLFPQKEVKNLALDFYLQGNGVVELVKSKGKWKAYHSPTRNWRAEKCNNKGEVVAYYYAVDWGKVEDGDATPTRVVNAKYAKGNEERLVFWVSDYSPANYYYAAPKYQGSLPHAEMEEEIANFHISNIKNGLSPSMIINMNNGDPGPEAKRRLKNEISSKLQGSSNSGKFILSFNDDSTKAATIEAAPLSDAHSQYEFLSREASEKILIGHRITSPKLAGVIDKNNGLGNNAEEIKTASQLFDNTVIRPLQNTVVEALDFVAQLNKMSFDFYFKTLQPIEFVEVDKTVQDKEEIEKETGVKLSDSKPSKCSCSVNLSKDDKSALDSLDDELADALINLGESEEDLLADFELIDEAFVDDYEEDERINELVKKEAGKEKGMLSKLVELISTGRAQPKRTSEQDGKDRKGDEYMVRYSYEHTTRQAKGSSRQFCQRMEAANKVYRKEDIVAMGNKSVNAGFGPRGAATYDIWLYKGGANCHHKWLRKIYKKRGSAANTPITEGNTITTSEAIRKGFRPEKNDKLVATAPIDTPTKGYLK
jgi:hypothetical protein